MYETDSKRTHSSNQAFYYNHTILEQPSDSFDCIELPDNFHALQSVEHIKLTKRERAIFLAIASTFFSTNLNKCFKSQATLGKDAAKYGWKVMNERRVNEVVAILTARGLITKSKQRRINKEKWSTIYYSVTELGESYYLQASNQIVYKHVSKPKITKKIEETGYGEIKNDVQVLSSSSLRSEAEYDLNSEILRDDKSELFLLMQNRISDEDAHTAVQKVNKNENTAEVVQIVRNNIRRGHVIRDIASYVVSLSHTLLSKSHADLKMYERERQYEQAKALEQSQAKTAMSNFFASEMLKNIKLLIH